METRIAFIALALFSAQANAEFLYVHFDDAGNRYLIDPTTKRQQGKYTLVWARTDYANAQIVKGKTVNSLKVLEVWDCSGFSFGMKNITAYSGKSGTGEYVHSTSLETHQVKFHDVAPDTLGEVKFEVVCGK
jgi:hypothetical protein